jgi:hypothetical protein
MFKDKAKDSAGTRKKFRGSMFYSIYSVSALDWRACPRIPSKNWSGIGDSAEKSHICVLPSRKSGRMKLIGLII